MTIFSEIYGAYFRIAAMILSERNVTESGIYDIIRREGFRDSALFLPRRLIPQEDGSDWGLLRRNPDGSLSAAVVNAPRPVLTRLQKMWLRAKLSDPKTALFLGDEEIKRLEKMLGDIPPLYKEEYFRFTDIFSDGDDFSSRRYRENFKVILSAVKRRELLEIQFVSGHGKRIRAKFLPIKIEYSQKNDKLRVYCHGYKRGRIAGGGTINIGRIEEVSATGCFIENPPPEERFLSRFRCGQPVTVRVTTERNAVERFTAEFASYEKQTERDPENGSITVKLFYNPQDETELLIRLLSFGPVLEIIAPEELRAQAAARVRAQAELIAPAG